MRKATRADLENALKRLAEYLPAEHLSLEQWGQRYRIIRQDHSRPFGSNWYSRAELYEVIWFGITAMRLAKEKSKCTST